MFQCCQLFRRGRRCENGGVDTKFFFTITGYTSFRKRITVDGVEMLPRFTGRRCFCGFLKLPISVTTYNFIPYAPQSASLQVFKFLGRQEWRSRTSIYHSQKYLNTGLMKLTITRQQLIVTITRHEFL